MPKIFTNEDFLLSPNTKMILHVIPEMPREKESFMIIYGITFPPETPPKKISKNTGMLASFKIYKNKDYITLFLDKPNIETKWKTCGIFIDTSLSGEIKLIKGKQLFSYEIDYATIKTPSETKTSKIQLKIVMENSIIMKKTIKSENESYVIDNTTGIPIQTGTPIISYHQLTKNGWIEMDPSEYFLKHVKDKDIKRNIKKQLDAIKEQVDIIIKKVKAKGKKKIDLIINQAKKLKI